MKICALPISVSVQSNAVPAMMPVVLSHSMPITLGMIFEVDWLTLFTHSPSIDPVST